MGSITVIMWRSLEQSRRGHIACKTPQSESKRFAVPSLLLHTRLKKELLRKIGASRRVPFDKNEGVVKRHFFSAMLCSTAGDLRGVEDRSSETLTVNQLSAARTNRSFRQPSIQSPTAAMILLSEPRFGFEEEFNLWLSDEPLNDKEICKLMRLVEDQRKAEGEAP